MKSLLVALLAVYGGRHSDRATEGYLRLLLTTVLDMTPDRGCANQLFSDKPRRRALDQISAPTYTHIPRAIVRNITNL